MFEIRIRIRHIYLFNAVLCLQKCIIFYGLHYYSFSHSCQCIAGIAVCRIFKIGIGATQKINSKISSYINVWDPTKLWATKLLTHDNQQPLAVQISFAHNFRNKYCLISVGTGAKAVTSTKQGDDSKPYFDESLDFNIFVYVICFEYAVKYDVIYLNEKYK